MTRLLKKSSRHAKNLGGSKSGGLNTTVATNVVHCSGKNSGALSVNCSGATCEVSCTGGGAANCVPGVNCNSGGGTCP